MFLTKGSVRNSPPLTVGHIRSVYNNYTEYKTNSGDWHMDLLSTDKILNCVAYFLVRYNI